MKILSACAAQLVLLAGFALGITTLAWADEVPAPQQSTPAAASEQSGDADAKDFSEGLVAQEFPLHGAAPLHVEFRYIDGKLKNVYFWNTGEAVQLDIFAGEHVIGEGDELLLKAPNVQKIILHVRPYRPDVSERLESFDIAKTFVFVRNAEGLYEMSLTSD